MPDTDDSPEMSDAERRIESALSQLVPAPVNLAGREILLLAQLRRSARRVRVYRAAAAMLAVALTESLALRMWAPAPQLVRTEQRPSTREFSAPSVEATAAPPPELMKEFQLCQALADQGLAALPAAPPAAEIQGHHNESLFGPELPSDYR